MLLHVICLLMNDYITFTDDSVQSYRTAELANSEHVADLPHTQTNRSLLYSVFLLTQFLITFSPRAVDIVKCP